MCFSYALKFNKKYCLSGKNVLKFPQMKNDEEF